MRVTIDEDKCCGYAACLSVAGKVFDLAADNIATVLVEHPEGELADLAREAAAACPTAAIVLLDDRDRPDGGA
ncbi:ferredoxin [Actinomadura sp. LD22]|uniref:Ferredoxin n=1 Tax=Actinomadura physcomitrii TaxID=2650748 RepID=A0A6I4MCR8_9ACTN|nr:ferredoxin [Actinomadura physcomitrii]MWA03512.1 ferredoxin [Actinomadura physcomitrii]